MNTNPQRANLILSYNRQAEHRSKGQMEDWKITVLGEFLSLLKSEQKEALLEIGAGTDEIANSFRRTLFR